MKKHDWKSVELDGGHMGLLTVLKCAGCGASRGPAFLERRKKPFLAGYPDLPVSENDCEKAAKQISDFKASEEYRKREFDIQLSFAMSALRELGISHGVGGAVDRKTGTVNGRRAHWRFRVTPRAPEQGHKFEMNRRGVKTEFQTDDSFSVRDILIRFFDEPQD